MWIPWTCTWWATAIPGCRGRGALRLPADFIHSLFDPPCDFQKLTGDRTSRWSSGPPEAETGADETSLQKIEQAAAATLQRWRTVLAKHFHAIGLGQWRVCGGLELSVGEQVAGIFDLGPIDIH